MNEQFEMIWTYSTFLIGFFGGSWLAMKMYYDWGPKLRFRYKRWRAQGD